MHTYDYVIADAFTEQPLSGNPVAVFTHAEGLSAEDMQRIARELNLSETTFVFPPRKDGDYWVRIFTPVNELPFAGHPTLGTAVVLGQDFAGPLLKFETGMGTVPFQLQRDASGALAAVQMDQPVPTWSAYEHADVVLEALGLERSTLPVEMYVNGPRHVFVGLKDVASLAALKPDLRLLAPLPDVAINCFAGHGRQWRARMFSPAYGVTEDPATGSAAGPLALHLIRHDRLAFGEAIEIVQGVEIGRPSLMRAQVHGSLGRIGPIQVGGSGVIVAHGTFSKW
ncbi:PhzF family phenazine biosynthesis protein [Pseudomonas sp. App30]|uniref:PhzF family phenazine biosynthesis protein n=1 Tax=Pseudomonas sp. App30 TaxID=3068990 RepID=UPI003A808F5C